MSRRQSQLNSTVPAGMTVMFHVPYDASVIYNRGRQPNAPGEPTTDMRPFYAGTVSGCGAQMVGWPNIVGTINAMASQSGIARNRGVLPVVNRYGPLPTRQMFIAGVLQKT